MLSLLDASVHRAARSLCSTTVPDFMTLLLSLAALLCDNQGVTFGPAGSLSLFQLVYEPILGDEKTSWLLVAKGDVVRLSRSSVF